jgi:hypothetical protein
MSLMARLRRSRCPANERCNVQPDCPNRAVAYLSKTVYDGRQDEEVRACIEHPPRSLAAGAQQVCPSCGRTFWPDPFHFDCG